MLAGLMPARRKSGRPHKWGRAKYSMPSCTWARRAANGGNCPKSSPPVEKRLRHMLALAREGAPARQSRAQWRARRCHHRLPSGQEHLKRGLRAYDAGKKIKGRKRHMAVGSMGLLPAVVVRSAGIQDMLGARRLCSRACLPAATVSASCLLTASTRGCLQQWVQRCLAGE